MSRLSLHVPTESLGLGEVSMSGGVSTSGGVPGVARGAAATPLSDAGDLERSVAGDRGRPAPPPCYAHRLHGAVPAGTAVHGQRGGERDRLCDQSLMERAGRKVDSWRNDRVIGCFGNKLLLVSL